MPAILRRLSPVGLLAVALCATAGPGYLSVVGPPVVRFEKPASAPSEPLLALPPLAIFESRPTVPPVEPSPVPPPAGPLAPSAPTQPAVDLTPLDPVVSPDVPDLMMDPPTTNAPPVDSGIVAPQMFMRYFTGQPGTNGNGVSFFAPVGFIPPLPVPPPSSSASFQTVPPGKP